MKKAPRAAGSYAYISNTASSSVSVIDASTKKTVRDPIRVGGNPGALALDKNGNLYVGNANPSSRSISVLDVKSWTVLRKIDLDSYLPTSLALSNDERTLYVSLQEYPIPTDKTLLMRSAVGAINTSNWTKTLIDLSFGGPPVDGWPSPDGGCGGVGELAVNPKSDLLYVQVAGANKIAVIDTNTNYVVKIFQAGSGPWLSFAPDGLHYYAVNTYNLGGGVSIFKADDSVVEYYVGPGAGCRTPESLAVTPDSKWLYVSCVDSNNLSVIDANNYAAKPTKVSLGFSPSPVAITPNGKEAWVVGNGDDAKLVVIPTNTNVPGGEISIPDGGPNRIVFSK
jgi:YVTN family beta-propeller protein